MDRLIRLVTLFVSKKGVTFTYPLVLGGVGGYFSVYVLGFINSF